MDEATRPGLSRSRIIAFVLSGVLFLLLIWSLMISRALKNHPDPRSCFTTPWNQVHLCEQSSDYTPYKQIPDLFIRALILSEDASFFSHQGFDWFEIKESVKRNWQEKRYVRGGSTLSQQLAKNLYLSNEKTLSRKLNEILLARSLERKLEKWEILEKYANVVEFGPNIFGLKAGAQYHFQKEPKQLNLLEIAYLVAILPNPKRLAHGSERKQLSEEALRRMHRILRLLYKTQKISEEEWVYSQTLMDTEAWPFSVFDPGHYDYMEIPNVKSELETELENMDMDMDDEITDLEAEIKDREPMEVEVEPEAEAEELKVF